MFSSSFGSDREASTISYGLSAATVLKCVLRDTVLRMHHQLLCSWSKRDLSFLFLEKNFNLAIPEKATV